MMGTVPTTPEREALKELARCADQAAFHLPKLLEEMKMVRTRYAELQSIESGLRALIRASAMLHAGRENKE
jgi:hypothetical protein